MIIYLLLVHWLADFVFQSNYMAQNKSKNIKALGYHSFIYTLVLFVATIAGGWLWATVNGILHFIIDYFTSKINTSLLEEKRTHGFFVSVGFDQFLHISILLLTGGLL